jgi:hypothetical protein
MVMLFTILISVSEILYFTYNSSCAKYILDIIGYSDSPAKIGTLSLYNHGNPFSISLASACSLIFSRVPTLKIYFFKMSLFFRMAINSNK